MSAARLARISDRSFLRSDFMASLREQVGALIRHHRDRAGLTQSELGERLDIAPETVSRLERGSLAPSFETLSALANTLNVEVRDFFEIGGHSVRPDASDPLSDLLSKLTVLDSEDLRWAADLLEVAMSRKVRR